MKSLADIRKSGFRITVSRRYFPKPLPLYDINKYPYDDSPYPWREVWLRYIQGQGYKRIEFLSEDYIKEHKLNEYLEKKLRELLNSKGKNFDNHFGTPLRKYRLIKAFWSIIKKIINRVVIFELLHSAQIFLGDSIAINLSSLDPVDEYWRLTYRHIPEYRGEFPVIRTRLNKHQIQDVAKKYNENPDNARLYVFVKGRGEDVIAKGIKEDRIFLPKFNFKRYFNLVTGTYDTTLHCGNPNYESYRSAMDRKKSKLDKILNYV